MKPLLVLILTGAATVVGAAPVAVPAMALSNPHDTAASAALLALCDAIKATKNLTMAKSMLARFAVGHRIDSGDEGPRMSRNVGFRLEHPVSAFAFSKAMGWIPAYLFSGDVHQRTWSIGLPKKEDRPPTFENQVYLALPRQGDLIIEASIRGRPSGPPPKMMFIPSAPAFDLPKYDQQIVIVNLRYARPGYDD